MGSRVGYGYGASLATLTPKQRDRVIELLELGTPIEKALERVRKDAEQVRPRPDTR